METLPSLNHIARQKERHRREGYCPHPKPNAHQGKYIKASQWFDESSVLLENY